MPISEETKDKLAEHMTDQMDIAAIIDFYYDSVRNDLEEMPDDAIVMLAEQKGFSL